MKAIARIGYSPNDAARMLANHSDFWGLSLSWRCWRPRLLNFFCAPSLSVMFAVLPTGAWAQQLRLTNPTSIERPEEVVELSLDQVARNLRFSATEVQSLVATDAATKQRIPSQLYSSRPDA